MSKAVDAGDALSELEQSLMNLNKHEHDTSGLARLHAIQRQVAEDVGGQPCAHPCSEAEKFKARVEEVYRKSLNAAGVIDYAKHATVLDLMVPEGHEGVMVRAQTACGWYFASMAWDQGKAESSRFAMELVKHSARHATLYIKSAHPYAWTAQVEYRECAKPVSVGKYGIVKVDWEAMGLPPVPAREFSAPGEPLRVKVLEDGTFTVSKEKMYRSRIEHQTAMPDPLDQVIDGKRLRDLVNQDQRCQRRDDTTGRRHMTPAQRAAVSAHWSAQLRLRVEVKRKDDEAAAVSVRYCEVEPWE